MNVNLWGKCCDVTKNVYIWKIFSNMAKNVEDKTH